MADALLIVDDEEDICDFLIHMARELDLEADSALSGEEALKRLKEKDYRLAVVDLKLSTAVTGLDVIKALRAERPRTAVAAMSGYVDMDLKREAERLGVSDYLEKPGDLKPEIFSRKIKALLERSV